MRTWQPCEDEKFTGRKKKEQDTDIKKRVAKNLHFEVKILDMFKICDFFWLLFEDSIAWPSFLSDAPKCILKTFDSLDVYVCVSVCTFNNL